jgi:hypothetical protein
MTDEAGDRHLEDLREVAYESTALMEIRPGGRAVLFLHIEDSFEKIDQVWQLVRQLGLLAHAAEPISRASVERLSKRDSVP